MTFSFRQLLIAGFLLAFVGGCYYDNEEELYGIETCDVSSVTYSGTILPELEANCFTCHSSGVFAVLGGGIELEGYNKLKVHVDNGKLVGAVNWRAGFSAMPKGGVKWSDCQIQKLEKWISDGALEN